LVDQTRDANTGWRPTAVGQARRFDAGKPTLDDSPDIGPLHVNEANANVVLEHGSDVVSTARISGETVGQRHWVLASLMGKLFLIDTHDPPKFPIQPGIRAGVGLPQGS
jgi:hypothetical protein